ncbi:hypothetical protein C8Q77DRAFT_1144911 [Trametes polyzona]|nr:hypothetical protein C8Q77DRAFT_1144911 [Trametes polyzona]
MGVHGLTTYLREHKPLLSRTVHLPLPHPVHGVHGVNPAHAGRVPVVLDGWSFIYEVVHCAGLPWVYGGEYPQLSQLIRQIAHAWTELGMELHFVLDGPYPTLKFPTLVTRITQNNVQNGLLFFRTSPAARATPRFLHETAMLPPLAYGVCVDTLTEMASESHAGKLHIHVADEEGDPYAVALAGRLCAYVAGRDSDFVVLNAEGYKGYVPLDEMVWTVTRTGDAEGSVYSMDTETDLNGDDDGFKPARTGKARKKRAAVHQNAGTGRGIIPPEDAHEPDAHLSLSFTVYSPTTLAAHLNIPVSLLPLLGALVGNDFTGSSDDAGPPLTTMEIRTNRRANLQRLFFERQLTLGQRIARVAAVLAELLAAAFGQGTSGAGPHKKRAKRQIGSVMELIDAAVGALLLRPLDTFATGEKEAIIERVVEATLQYAIPRPPDDVDVDAEAGEGELQWLSDVCPLHVAETCPLFTSLSRLVLPSPEEPAPEAGPPAKAVEDLHSVVRAQYVAAYRRGHLNPHILDAVQSATMWPWLFLEDPDKECVARTIGRPIRDWTYAILDASVGLPNPPEPEPVEGEEVGDEDEGEDDEDELIDVVEEEDNVDPLARLRGALKELDEPEDGDGDSAGQEPPPSILSASTTALTSSQPKVITEYVRRGTRLAAEEVSVTPLGELLRGIELESPVHAQTRLSLPPPLWPEEKRRMLLLRALGSDCPAVWALPEDHMLAVLALRFVVRRLNERAQENPGVRERQLERWTQAEGRAFVACVSREEGEDPKLAAAEGQAVPVAERSVQLVAQISAALEEVERLAQVLLLSPILPSPARRFSGMRYHGMLSGVGGRPEDASVDESVWRACVEGLEEAYGALPQRKSKKEKKRQAVAAAVEVTKPAKTKGPQKTAASMFALLADAEA